MWVHLRPERNTDAYPFDGRARRGHCVLRGGETQGRRPCLGSDEPSAGRGHPRRFARLETGREIQKTGQPPLADPLHRDGPQNRDSPLAKYLPLSVEFQTAAALDGLAEAGKDQHLDAVDGSVTLMPEDAPDAEVWESAPDADNPEADNREQAQTPEQKAA